MEIEQHVWGMTPEGEAVILYILRNASGAEVRLSTYGATVVSVKTPDRTGRIDDVALEYESYESYIGDPASPGKTLGRCAGTIRYASAEIEGQLLRLHPSYGPHHRNGGPKGFGDRLWDARTEGNRVVMSLTSEDGDQGYPGTLEVEAIFDFDDDNALEITYQAYSDRTTIVNLACNLCLNLSGKSAGHNTSAKEAELSAPYSEERPGFIQANEGNEDGHSAGMEGYLPQPKASSSEDEHIQQPTASPGMGGHLLRLRASTMLDTDEQAIPTDHVSGVEDTPFDFTAWRTLHEGFESHPAASDSGCRIASCSSGAAYGSGCGTASGSSGAAYGSGCGTVSGSSGAAYGSGYGTASGAIGIHAGCDLLYPIDGWRPNILTEAGELRDPHTGRCVTILTSQPCIALSTSGQPMQGCYPFGPGMPHADQTGIVLRCCSHPGTLQPTLLLHPGELYVQKTVYRFGVFE